MKYLFHNFVYLELLAILTLSGCQTEFSGTEYVEQYQIMGTNVEVKLYGDPEHANSAALIIKNELTAVEKTCNLFDPESELSKLNATAAKEPFKCSDLLWEVLISSRKFYDLSEGSFDITVTPLMELWGFYRKRSTLPSAEEIAEARKHVGLDKVLFDLRKHTVKFTEEGIKLDLGGIAKGYALDRAVDAVISRGKLTGLVNLGGNIRCFPRHLFNKKKYEIGIRDPFGGDGICGSIQVSDTSISTSGNYEKYVTIDGVKYTHIMDPKSCMPVKDMIAVTVVTPRATDGDALSTAIFVKGEDFARKICQKIPKTYVLIIKPDPNDPAKPVFIKIGDIWKDCGK